MPVVATGPEGGTAMRSWRKLKATRGFRCRPLVCVNFWQHITAGDRIVVVAGLGAAESIWTLARHSGPCCRRKSLSGCLLYKKGCGMVLNGLASEG